MAGGGHDERQCDFFLNPTGELQIDYITSYETLAHTSAPPVKMFSNPLHLPKWELWLLWLYRDCAVLSDRCSCSARPLNAFSQTQTQTDTCAPTEELNHQHHHTLEYTERRTDKYPKWTLFVSVSILFISVNVYSSANGCVNRYLSRPRQSMNSIIRLSFTQSCGRSSALHV